MPDAMLRVADARSAHAPTLSGKWNFAVDGGCIEKKSPPSGIAGILKESRDTGINVLLLFLIDMRIAVINVLL